MLNAPNKTCDNDPIPTKIIKDCINELLPTISNMVNLSLSSGHFPDICKESLVRPKLNKVNMDLIKKNYRPVRNLAFLSKITEKAAALQIFDHVPSNQMLPEFQSAYRKNHRTETALLRMRNIILVNMNKKQVTLQASSCQQRTVMPMIPVSIWLSIQMMLLIKTPSLQQWKRASVTFATG